MLKVYYQMYIFIFSNLADDNLNHDCENIREIVHANQAWKSDPILKNLQKIKTRYIKYNHAYGIPLLGIESFKNESMIRGCYLIR